MIRIVTEGYELINDDPISPKERAEEWAKDIPLENISDRALVDLGMGYDVYVKFGEIK